MIPIYRGLKLGTENEYVIGWYSSPIIVEGKLYYLSITNQNGEHRIDTTTLSIHFPDIIDSQGNKIFASLNGDGKGGDIVEYNGKQEIIKYSNGTIATYMFRFEDLKELSFEAVGIQE
jgi:hypothetical protein